jgi:nucleotide-binding universal stress UspA family protein
MPRILAATDLSPCAGFAETRAAMLCAELSIAKLGLMTVIDDSLAGSLGRLLKGSPGPIAGLAEQAGRTLDDIARRLQQDHEIACDCHVDTGRPATCIAERAEAMPADLVVVGAHGCNAITPAFIGNTPYRLLHIGRHSILIVREQPAGPYRNVLVPVDFSDDSMRAAQLALTFAPAASVTLLHGFEVMNEGMLHYAGVSTEFIGGYRNAARAEAVAEMDRFMAGLDAGARQLPVSASVQFGYPPFVIQEYARTFSPDLIVIGKHGQSAVEDFLLGSVTRHTLDETTCDLLVALSPHT